MCHAVYELSSVGILCCHFLLFKTIFKNHEEFLVLHCKVKIVGFCYTYHTMLKGGRGKERTSKENTTQRIMTALLYDILNF